MCSPAASCIKIAAADQSPWVKELAIEIHLEHRSACSIVPPASSPMGLLTVYGVCAMLVAGKVALWRLAKAASRWVDGMGWAVAIRLVYASP